MQMIQGGGQREDGVKWLVGEVVDGVESEKGEIQNTNKSRSSR